MKRGLGGSLLTEAGWQAVATTTFIAVPSAFALVGLCDLFELKCGVCFMLQVAGLHWLHLGASEPLGHWLGHWSPHAPQGV